MIKFRESVKPALINAAVPTVVFFIISRVTGWLFSDKGISGVFPVVVDISGAGLIFITSFLVFRFTVDRFLYSKIKLIYKSIHAVKSGKKEVHDRNATISLENVKAEVTRWENEKQDEMERMKGLEQYRRDFIGNLSHEMKTPLFNIQGYVSTLIDGGLHDPSINLEYLQRTEKSVDRLVRILEDLDEIAQLESGQLKLHVIRFDLVSLTKEVIEMLEIKAAKKEIQVILNEPDKPVMVEGDRDKIRQVLVNILDNSLRYGRRGEGRTRIAFFDMEEHILTEITDNGIGIEQSEIPRVFERFYRTEQGRNVSKKGKGLGLAIVKHIIEAHGQTVQVRSATGVGTTFGFTLKKT